MARSRNQPLITALVTGALLGIALGGCKERPDHDMGDSLPRDLAPEPAPAEPLTPRVTIQPDPAPSFAPDTPSQPLS